MISNFSIICPDEELPVKDMSILAIMSKVRLEAFMWGAGTALGKWILLFFNLFTCNLLI